MTEEYYISPEPNMRLPTQRRISNPEFQAALVGAKSMRSKLAACYAMLSQQGAFSDSGPDVWELRQEVESHLTEELEESI